MRLKKNNKRKTHCLKNWQNKRLHGKLKRYNKKILTRPFSWETSEFLNLKPKAKQILRQVVTSYVILKFKFPSCYWVSYNLGALNRLLPTKCNETFFPANCQKRNSWRKLNVNKIPSRNETRRKKKQRVGKLIEFHSKISATDKKWEEFAWKTGTNLRDCCWLLFSRSWRAQVRVYPRWNYKHIASSCRVSCWTPSTQLLLSSQKDDLCLWTWNPPVPRNVL